MSGLLHAEHEALLSRTREQWLALDGTRVMVMGAGGFAGTNFVAALAHARRRLNIDVRLAAWARDANALLARAPALGSSGWCQVLTGDAHDLTPPSGQVDLVVLALGTGAEPGWAVPSPARGEALWGGTERVAAFATESRARLLMLSSALGTDASHAATVGQLERAARAAHPSCVIARGVHGVGPFLSPTRAPVGPLLVAAASGAPIPRLSPQAPAWAPAYGVDVAGWMIALLLQGAPALTVALDDTETVAARDVAPRLAALARLPVDHATEPGMPAAPEPVTVPGDAQSGRALGLRASMGLDDALRRTVLWFRQQGAATAAPRTRP